MNVLEKILEEIEKEQNSYEADHAWNYSKGMEYAKEIIRSHIGGATDTDDTEEKIREHIAECLHRIDNIRSFIGSKEYTSNDEKCIRNIEVLKTSITALEEYLNSKKKNGNNGWIPVEDGLPEVPKELEDAHCPEFNVTIKGAEKATTLKYSWDGTWFDDNGNVYNVIAWQPLPAPYKPKKNIPVAGMDHIMSGFTKVE